MELAHNNYVIEPLRVSPFKANYGFDLDFVVSKAPELQTKVATLQEVQVFIDKLQNLHETLKLGIAYT